MVVIPLTVDDSWVKTGDLETPSSLLIEREDAFAKKNVFKKVFLRRKLFLYQIESPEVCEDWEDDEGRRQHHRFEPDHDADYAKG